MKNTKKVLALVLAVVMLMSTFAMAAFAYTAGDEVSDGTTNVKFEVTQVPEASMPDGTGTYTAVDNDIYAVTMYAKTSEGIDFLQFPVGYNKNHFDIIALIDGTDKMTSQDAGENTIYVYKMGAAWRDTTMYKRNGQVASSKALARFIGLGNSNATAVDPTIYNYSEDMTTASNYSKWTSGFDKNNYDVIMVNIDEQAVEKNAYFNAIKNQIVNDWVEIITLYFTRKDGVAESACYGDKFGFEGDACYGVYATTDKSGLPSFFNSEAAYVEGANEINAVAGAVEAQIKPLANLTANNAKNQQILFNPSTATSADEVTSVDYRFVCQFSTTAFPIAYNEETMAVTDTQVEQVGFVLARKDSGKTYADLTAFDAAGVAALPTEGSAVTDIVNVKTNKISTTTAGGAAFAFSCRIKNIAVNAGTVAAEYIAVPYVVSGGTVTFGLNLLTSDVQGRYNTYIDQFIADNA